MKRVLKEGSKKRISPQEFVNMCKEWFGKEEYGVNENKIDGIVSKVVKEEINKMINGK